MILNVGINSIVHAFWAMVKREYRKDIENGRLPLSTLT